MTDKFICSICEKPYTGFGNNAQPVNDGRCCDYCNMTVVVPTRMGQLPLGKRPTDIVDRLRDAPVSIPLAATGHVNVCEEAADEIERLRATLRRICEPITFMGDADAMSACQDLHELICAQAREALRE